jgi:hypothetical protein
MSQWKCVRWGVALCLALLAGATQSRAQDVAFGGIELASSSVKGLTFVFQPGTDAAAQGGGARPERMQRLQYAERNASFISMKDGCKLNERGMNLLIKDTSEVVQELRDGAKEKNLPTLKLFVVGSSGLGAVCNTDEIVAKVRQATGLCAEFITASDEAKYNLGFVLPRDRYKSMIIDISGGNTLGGYYVTTRGAAWPPREWHGFELKYGSRTLKDKALALSRAQIKDNQGVPIPPPDYWHAVDIVLHQEVLPALDQIKEESAGLENFSQVYMVGGAIWGVSTRMKPVQQEEWAISALSLPDFDAVLSKLRDGTYRDFDDGQFGPKVSAKTRQAAEDELRDVGQRFDPQSLYAGVALARYIVQETTPFARVYFPTTAAWISGYAREKFREAGSTQPACSAGLQEKKGD